MLSSCFDSERLVGVCGAEQVPGKVKVTAFDAMLVPRALTARTAKVYVPEGTPENEKRSLTPPKGNDSDRSPLTSRTMSEGAPPVNVFCQASARWPPSVSPSRLVGAEGGAGTPTLNTTSFDGWLSDQPRVARTRT